mmetsp:Transcript_5508/g.16758  ORF Transcript_5508/g.16758 Transcript_5508/m.16758 type:complete len:294 (-) Transcript_5508:537-1418(-)
MPTAITALSPSSASAQPANPPQSSRPPPLLSSALSCRRCSSWLERNSDSRLFACSSNSQCSCQPASGRPPACQAERLARDAWAATMRAFRTRSAGDAWISPQSRASQSVGGGGGGSSRAAWTPQSAAAASQPASSPSTCCGARGAVEVASTPHTCVNVWGSSASSAAAGSQMLRHSAANTRRGGISAAASAASASSRGPFTPSTSTPGAPTFGAAVAAARAVAANSARRAFAKSAGEPVEAIKPTGPPPGRPLPFSREARRWIPAGGGGSRLAPQGSSVAVPTGRCSGCGGSS